MCIGILVDVDDCGKFINSVYYNFFILNTICPPQQYTSTCPNKMCIRVFIYAYASKRMYSSNSFLDSTIYVWLNAYE
jgi:hypothetical protein